MLDQFYTPQKTVFEIINFLEEHELLINKKIIEPSAGTGSFYYELKKRGYEVQAFDLDPKFPECQKIDWFNVDIVYGKNNIVVGNPPYGKKGKLARDFINHSFKFADTVCFIVPLTLSTSYTAQKHIKNKLIYDIEIPINFINEGKIKKIPSKFQVWSKTGNDIRLQKPQTEHPDFETKIYNKTEGAKKWLQWDWDIAVKRNTKKGEFILKGTKATPDYHWILIKANTVKALVILKNIDYSSLNNNKMTAGIGKADIVKAYSVNF